MDHVVVTPPARPFRPTRLQQAYAAYLLEQFPKRPPDKVASEAIECNACQISTWRRNPGFLTWLDDYLRVDARFRLGRVYQALVSKAEAGEEWAVKLVLDRFDPVDMPTAVLPGMVGPTIILNVPRPPADAARLTAAPTVLDAVKVPA